MKLADDILPYEESVQDVPLLDEAALTGRRW